MIIIFAIDLTSQYTFIFGSLNRQRASDNAPRSYNCMEGLWIHDACNFINKIRVIAPWTDANDILTPVSGHMR
jgi:hypothetical protein